MKHSFRTISIAGLLLSLVISPSFADNLDLDDPIPEGIEFLEDTLIELAEDHFRDLAILDSVIRRMAQLQFGGVQAVDRAAELVNGAFDWLLECGRVKIVLVAHFDVDDLIPPMRPMMALELRFVRFVCSDLTKDQRSAIRVAAENSVREVATQVARNLNKFDANADLNDSLESSSLIAIRGAISDSLRLILSDEQFEQFSEIAQDRVDQRKRAAILSAVARIDGHLMLTPDQRDKIGEVLSLNWRPRWERLALMQAFEIDSLPLVPDELVVGNLNDSQKLVWLDIGKFDVSEIDLWDDDEIVTEFGDGWWGDFTPDTQLPEAEVVFEK